MGVKVGGRGTKICFQRKQKTVGQIQAKQLNICTAHYNQALKTTRGVAKDRGDEIVLGWSKRGLFKRRKWKFPYQRNIGGRSKKTQTSVLSGGTKRRYVPERNVRMGGNM